MLSILSILLGIIHKPFTWFLTLSLKKKIGVLTVLGIVLFVGYQNVFGSSKTPAYTTAEAKKDTITEVVTETGTIAVNGRVDIFSPTNGVVSEVLVRNGDMVQVGDKLFVIKSTATEQEKTQALAAYQAAKNTLDTANATLFSLQSSMFSQWDSYKELAESDTYENGDGSPRSDARANPEYHAAEKDWLAAEANYKKQQAVISQAQTAVNSAYLLYQATQNATVKATADGIIANLSVATGSFVKANLITTPTRPIATIANQSTTEVVVSLSETDIAKIAEGQQAIIEVNAVHDKVYNGVVKRVDTIGTDEQGVIRYNVYIQITNPDTQLRAGMNADVSITTKRLTNVLSVPNGAVKPYKGKRAVRVPDEKGEINYIPVEIGAKGDKRTQIRSGIQEGQIVITSLSNEQLKRPGLFGN